MMVMRIILHSDCNGFYASVECLYDPGIRNMPVAVCGDSEKRHGIVLAKNEIAKKYNIKTGDTIWQALEKCPELYITKPHFDRYLRLAKMARRIYSDYTDMIEPFGLDEAWLDITNSVKNLDEGVRVADEIRRRIKYELGITVSIGVSFNKIFAKLGSDYKKPDAVTVISKQNYKSIVFPLPAECLLGVGKATKKRLLALGIHTIGDIANEPQSVLKAHLGKFGDTLYNFANGYDFSPVKHSDHTSVPKSIGNSTTPSRNMESLDDIKIVMGILCDSVCRRAREYSLKAGVVTISIRDRDLYIITRQKKLLRSTDITKEVTDTALGLFLENYDWKKSVRSVGVTLSELTSADEPEQTSLFTDEKNRQRQKMLDSSVDVLKRRFGSYCVQPAIMLGDTELSGFSPKEDNIVHPISFFT